MCTRSSSSWNLSIVSLALPIMEDHLCRPPGLRYINISNRNLNLGLAICRGGHDIRNVIDLSEAPVDFNEIVCAHLLKNGQGSSLTVNTSPWPFLAPLPNMAELWQSKLVVNLHIKPLLSFLDRVPIWNFDTHDHSTASSIMITYKTLNQTRCEKLHWRSDEQLPTANFPQIIRQPGTDLQLVIILLSWNMDKVERSTRLSARQHW